MSSVFSSILNAIGLGDDGDDVRQAAERQAAETRKAAEQAADRARLDAQAAQIQREGLSAREAAETQARELAPKAMETPEVTLGPAPTTSPLEAARKRNPRSAFTKRQPSSSISI